MQNLRNTFAIFGSENTQKINNSILENFKETDARKLADGQWLVKSEALGASALYEMLAPGDEPVFCVILPVTQGTYYGYLDAATWDWVSYNGA